MWAALPCRDDVLSLYDSRSNGLSWFRIQQQHCLQIHQSGKTRLKTERLAENASRSSKSRRDLQMRRGVVLPARGAWPKLAALRAQTIGAPAGSPTQAPSSFLGGLEQHLSFIALEAPIKPANLRLTLHFFTTIACALRRKSCYDPNFNIFKVLRSIYYLKTQPSISCPHYECFSRTSSWTVAPIPEG